MSSGGVLAAIVRARRSLLLVLLLSSTIVRAEVFPAAGRPQSGIPGLMLDLNFDIGGGSFGTPARSLRPLSGLPSGAISPNTSPGRGTALIGISGDVLFMLADTTIGLRAGVATALWNGNDISLGGQAGWVWRLDRLRVRLLAEVGAEALSGAGGGLFTSGSPETIWLPQAGGSVALTFVGWMGTQMLVGLWGRRTWWRHDVRFVQLEGAERRDVEATVGGYLWGLSFGMCIDP